MSRSIPPSARTTSVTARVALAASPKSPAIATARAPDRPSAATVSAASSLRLRYPTATAAPARASSRAVARPMPRPPPVTNARLPVRSITGTVPSAFRLLALHSVFHDLADYVLDGEVQLLDARGVIGRDDQDEVGEVLELAAALAQERYDRHAACLRGLRGAHQVGTLATGRVQHQQIFRLRQCFDLAREDLVEP